MGNDTTGELSMSIWSSLIRGSMLYRNKSRSRFTKEIAVTQDPPKKLPIFNST